ncbi:MAG TPA: phosphoglucomutase (alpha-D-glucose-1,6-bisphosphate-dependent) [Rhizomicrobium sp.]|nr:phosphoglucomutase (alpha-D-glucose-1,6-bisphosphate-dependent) [Rhizomicrobium sp.]
MPRTVDPHAGLPVTPDMLVDVPRLVTAYFALKPDVSVAAQQVAFGTSGHRGSAFASAFNEDHIVAITQAICDDRRSKGIDGPLFIGRDTHALSEPALASALEVLIANGVTVMADAADGFTPTPVISHAILTYNRGRAGGLADGIVITPSHNPPDEGGFKYNPPNGGPADIAITDRIQNAANDMLRGKLAGVKRVTLTQARKSALLRRHDYVGAYVADLGNVVDMEAIRGAGVKIGIDPLGGAAVHFWAPIVERYRLDATVVDNTVDPTFRFMTADWDGKIRMDCSSPYAMKRLIGLKDKFDVAFANDTDADRHGIVCRSVGLLEPNKYLAAAISYLFANRPQWPAQAAVGKTAVSSAMIDRVAADLKRKLFEVPVGFKWFVDGLGDGSLGFGGEESAGAAFLRRDGAVWTTDKDGPILGLLAAEMTARSGRDPGQIYGALEDRLGQAFYERIDAPATPAQKAAFKTLSPAKIAADSLAGDPITAKLDKAPGNGAALGGVKVVSRQGWFAARPSGTEDVYKIYAESFRSAAHLRQIQDEAQKIVTAALGAAS